MIQRTDERLWQRGVLYVAVMFGLLMLGGALVQIPLLFAVAALGLTGSVLAVTVSSETRLAAIIVAVVLSNPVVVGPISFQSELSLLRVVLVVAMGAELIRRKRAETSSQGVTRAAMLIAAVALAAWALAASYGRSGNTAALTSFVLDVVLLPALLLLVFLAKGTQRQTRVLCHTIASLLTAELLVGLYEYVTEQNAFSSPGGELRQDFGTTPGVVLGVRADGTFSAPEPYAVVSGLLAIYLVHDALLRGRSGTAVLAAAAGFATSFFSGMRGVAIPLVVVLLTIFIAHAPSRNRKVHRRTAAGLVVASMLLLSIAPTQNVYVSERIQNAESAELRLASFRSAAAIFANSPVYGVGFGNYVDVAQDPENTRTFGDARSLSTPHNTVLAVFAEGGTIAGLLYGALLYFIARSVLQVKHHPRPTAALWFVIGSMLTVNVGYYATVTAATAVVLAAGVGARSLRSPSIPDRAPAVGP